MKGGIIDSLHTRIILPTTWPWVDSKKKKKKKWNLLVIKVYKQDNTQKLIFKMICYM